MPERSEQVQHGWKNQQGDGGGYGEPPNDRKR
jgi:hypothetical protein